MPSKCACNHSKNKKMTRHFTVLATLVSVCLIISNLFETKIFACGPLTLTGGFLVFPITYIINDCLSEVYGYKRTRNVVVTAFGLNLLVVLLAQIVRILPPAPFWDGQEHFDYIFNADFRITVASMAAFIVGSLLNSRLMTEMKRIQGEKGFGFRAIVSSLAGEAIDSLIFFPIAFRGVGTKNMLTMMVTQVFLKTFYEVVILPVTSMVVRKIKSDEAAASQFRR